MTKTEEAKLLKDHDRLIRYEAAKLATGDDLMEDLLQVGRIAFLLAARRWVPTATVWTYALRFVRCDMKRAARKAKLRSVVEAPSGEQIEWMKDPAQSPEEQLAVREIMSTLGADSRRVVLARVLEELTVREIAAADDTSKSDVDRTYHAAIGELRESLDS